MSNVVAGIDLGNVNTKISVAYIDGDESNILATEIFNSDYIKNNNFIDEEKGYEDLKNKLNIIESKIEKKIKKIIFSIPPRKMSISPFKLSIEPQENLNGVLENIEKSYNEVINFNQKHFQKKIPINFLFNFDSTKIIEKIIDDNGLKDRKNISGSIYYVDEEYISNLNNVVSRIGLEYEFIISPITLSSYFLSMKNKINDELIDFSSRNTSFSIFIDGLLKFYYDDLYGGNDITEAIINKYSIDYTQAEFIKNNRGSLLPSDTTSINYFEIIDNNGNKEETNDLDFSKIISKIIKKNYIKIKNKESLINNDKQYSIFLNGSATNLGEIKEFTEIFFNDNYVNIINDHNNKIRLKNYSRSLSALQFELNKNIIQKFLYGIIFDNSINIETSNKKKNETSKKSNEFINKFKNIFK